MSVGSQATACKLSNPNLAPVKGKQLSGRVISSLKAVKPLVKYLVAVLKLVIL
jgi:hypothetical protein